MRIVFSILISVLAWASAFAQNPTSVYWIKSRVTDSTTVSYPTGWGVIYYNGQSSKWRICNGSGVCKDVGSGTGGSVAWGDITGLISAQTDLQDSLLYKRNLKTKLRTFTTNHTIQAADAERIVFMNSASSNNFTVAPNSSVAIPLYTTIWLSQIGAGVTTVVEGGGVTVTSSSGSLLAPGQNALMLLYKTGTDTWMLFNGTAILPIDLTADVTGVLPYANGGLGLSTLGTAGQSLRVNVGETGYEFYTPSVGSGTVTSVSVTPANGVSGSVATATTTPAITLSLGAITPSSVNSVVISGSSTPTIAVTGTTTISGTHSGTSSGTNTGDQTSVTGNAGTATALATPRTIGTLTGDATSAGSSFDGTANNTNAITLATVNSNVGSFGSATLAPILTVNGKGLITAVSTATITPAIGSVTGLGTGVATALGVNIGSAGAPVLFNGAGGTPSSMTGTNITGTASGLTAGNVTTNANFTGPITSSGNVTSVAAQTGTGSTFVMNTAPTMTNPVVGTQAANDNSTKAASTAYVETAAASRIEDAINDGETAKAPTENIVYDNLLLKVDKSANLTDLASGPTALKNIGGIERASVANTQTGTTYTLVASDFTSFTKLYLSNASSHTVTIPLNSVTPITAGITLLGRRRGAGAVTFTIAGGGTIVSTSGSNLDPGVDQLWALTKREGTTDTWDLDNGGTPLGAANQILGVNTGATGQEYKTVSNGMTAASGTIKLGGALTADTNLSGAFSLGIGASPTSKLHVLGLGTTTGGLGLFEDNGGTDRVSLLDNGAITHAATLSGTGTLGIGSTITTSSTANSQTLGGFDFVVTPSYGANTGVTLNTFRVRSTTAAADYYKINQTSSGTASSQIWDASTIYDFKNSSSTSIIRNSAAALSLRGGTASTTRMLQFTTTVASSVAANNAFNFTGNTHDYGSAVTRTNTEILNDATITSVNGSTLTYTVFDNSPGFTLGTSTATLTGYNYNPTLTSGTFTHYAMRVQSGLSAFGTTSVPTALIMLGAGSTAASSAPLKFISGSLMTTAEVGAEEFLTDKKYFTITTGAARKEVTLNDAALTSGTFPVATTNGRLTDSGLTTSNLKAIYSGGFSGAGTATTTFTVTIGATLGATTYEVVATPSNVLSAALFYVNNKTTTTFDVVYLTGLTGTVAFDWIVTP